MRDDANLNQLLVLANMESYNAILIEQGIFIHACLDNHADRWLEVISVITKNRGMNKYGFS